MALTKLTMQPEGDPSFAVLFNPNSYSITKSVTWSAPQSQGSQNETKREVNAPPLVFGGGGSRQLSLELFFDVTEHNGNRDVRDETNKIAALTRIDKRLKTKDKGGRPQWCKVSWGKEGKANSDFPFTGVITNLAQKFTLFDSDGTPLRATLSVTFTEYLSPEDDKRQTDPEATTWMVKRGDTLSAIAADVYRDPKKWRPIAEINGLDDPLHLEIGTRLSIP